MKYKQIFRFTKKNKPSRKIIMKKVVAQFLKDSVKAEDVIE